MFASIKLGKVRSTEIIVFFCTKLVHLATIHTVYTQSGLASTHKLFTTMYTYVVLYYVIHVL